MIEPWVLPARKLEALRVLDEVKDGLMPRLLIEGVEPFQKSWRTAAARAQDLAAPA
jgi:hypothetical protein